jgi:hypothetical protein
MVLVNGSIYRGYSRAAPVSSTLLASGVLSPLGS